MRQFETQPCSILADCVESYWYVEAGPDESSKRPDAILPNGTSNLIFNLSGYEHREYCDDDYSPSRSLRTRWFSGIRDQAIIVGPTVCTRVIGVRFKPCGLVPFLHQPITEVSKLTIEADDLWSRDSERLHEQLHGQPGVAMQFQLLERWLLERFRPQSRELGLLHAVAKLEQHDGKLPIECLASVANLSLRQFRRRFEAAVGLPPKRLARILRFRRLIERMGINADAPWASLALDCGYYDQSHLIADFRDFAGVTPSEYFRRQPVVPGFLPIDAPMSLFSNTSTTASS